MATKRNYKNVTPKKNTESTGDEFDSMLDNFNKGKSDHEQEDFEEEHEENDEGKKPTKLGKSEGKTEEPKSENPEQDKINFEAKKILFIKIANFAISGVHFLIFNFISKTKIEFNELVLDDEELERLDIYVTEELVKIIDFIPPWIFPIVHMEVIFIDKWKGIVKEKEKQIEELKKIEAENLKRAKEADDKANKKKGGEK